MENKHKKSKRSLNGDDVYELACRYDVGWSKSKSRKRRKDGEINDEQSDEGGKNVNEKGEHGDSPSVEMGSEVEDRCDDDNTLLNSSKTHDPLKKRKSLDIKNRIKRRKETLRVDASSEQDNVEPGLHPLHSQWRFTRKEMEELKSKGVKVKLGNWSKKEINMLESNMAEYLKANNISDPAPLVLAENGRRGKDIKMQSVETNFYRSLGKGIRRPLFNIYRRVIRVYNPENYVGRWSESETQDLLRFHGLFGDQWTKIGSCLGRCGMSVHHKFQELQGRNGYDGGSRLPFLQKLHFENQGCWSEEEIGRLDASVRASTGTEFGSQIYGDINWVEVADFVMTRTSYQCRAKWLKDVCWKTASGEKNIKWNSEDDVKLIERLYVANETDENDINWVLMTKDLPKTPSVTWLRSKWTTLKKAVPNYTECDFEEILDYLYNTHRPFLKKKTTENVEHT